MKVNITYKTKENRYKPSSTLVYLGRVCIGKVFYGDDNAKNTSKTWRSKILLPGFKVETVHVKHSDEGIERIEKCLKTWLEWSGLGDSEK